MSKDNGAVDGVQLLDELKETVDRYLVLPVGGADAIALWVLFAWAHHVATISPILGITAPTMRAGKSKLLELLRSLVPKPLMCSNLTPAAIYREMPLYRETFLSRMIAPKRLPTFLIDEADTFIRDNSLRGILNSGHIKADAVVRRVDPSTGKIKEFSTWAPKAIVMIGTLPSTLDDRSIKIRMHRKGNDESVERMRRDRIHGDLEPLRVRSREWTDQHLDDLREMDPPVLEELHDRAADNWHPLLSIADLAGGEWPRRAREAAVALEPSEQVESDGPLLLLADIWEVFDDLGTDKISSRELSTILCEREDRPWCEWPEKHIKRAHRISRLLRPFGIRTRQMWIGQTNVQGFSREMFEQEWRRYP